MGRGVERDRQTHVQNTERERERKRERERERGVKQERV